MSGALSRLAANALRTLRHDVESADGDNSSPSQLISLAEHVRHTLVDHEVRPGEPVHVRIGNRPADLGSLLGLWQAGAVAVPVHIAAAATTIETLQNTTRVRFCIDRDRIEMINRAPPPTRPLLQDAALVIFTSGSTGQPKGVVIGHQRLAEKLLVLDRLLGFHDDDVVLVPLHLTFIFGLWVSLLALRSGARLTLVPKFSSNAIMRGCNRGATILAGVPSMFRALPADPSASMPGLRMILTGGEVLPAPLAMAIQRAAVKAEIHDLYGLTETGSCDFHLGPADQPDGLGTIGAPTENASFRLLAADGSGAATDEVGELCIRTPYGMLGYLDNPRLTAASFHKGYFKTGDLACLRPDGRVQLIGRLKDIVSRGGIKIAPLEIDNLLSTHPDVAAALCAGVPDERLGETIHAVIVPRPGVRLNADTLREWMLARTERYKVPDVFYFRDTLPAGSTGKADRRAVAQLAASAARTPTR